MRELKNLAPSCSVSFSGHRPERLPGKGVYTTAGMDALIPELRQILFDSINRGKKYFLHGCMAGWDIVCAEQVIALKAEHPHIQLISVAPYKKEFFSREKCWTPDWIGRAQSVFSHHDVGIKIADNYRSGIYYERNRILVDYSSELICYWDGGNGGTKYTVDYASGKDKSVVNLVR